MREQKKDRAPAKGKGLIIGNRFHGDCNLGNIPGVHNQTDAQKLAEIKRTLVNGNVTFLKVCKALEIQFLRGQDEN